MESEFEEETERGLEEKAERYSELHSDESKPSMMSYAVGRLRRLLGRH